MRLSNALYLAGLLSLAATHPVSNITTSLQSSTSPATSTVLAGSPQITLLTLPDVSFEVELELGEAEVKLESELKDGKLRFEFEIEIGDVDVVDIDAEAGLPALTIPAPPNHHSKRDYTSYNSSSHPHELTTTELEEEKKAAEEDVHRDFADDLGKRFMNEIKCSLPHTRLAPSAGELFRAHFHSLNKEGFQLKKHKHMTWKYGPHRFRVENHLGKDADGGLDDGKGGKGGGLIHYADLEFAAQQMGLVCPTTCKGKGCWGKDGVYNEGVWYRIYTVPTWLA